MLKQAIDEESGTIFFKFFFQVKDCEKDQLRAPIHSPTQTNGTTPS